MKKKEANKPLTPETAIRQLRNKELDRRAVRSFAGRLAFLIVFVYLLFGVLFRLVPVPNDDMKPALRARDLQLVYCYPSTLWNNEIVVYEEDGKERTGRIVARPGDVVEITEDAQLKINNGFVSEGDIYYSTPAYESEVTYPFELQEDEYFILSDFREGAIDSRQFGPIARDQITGKVIAVLRRSGL